MCETSLVRELFDRADLLYFFLDLDLHSCIGRIFFSDLIFPIRFHPDIFIGKERERAREKEKEKGKE